MESASIGRVGKSKRAARPTTAPRFNSESFLACLGTARSTVKYRPQQTVFRQGTAADAVYYIQKGRIRLTVMSEHGKEAIIAQLGAGQFFGEGCLAGQDLHMASAVATAESTVAKIETETMIRVLHERPELAEMFVSFLLSRNVRIEADLISQLFNSSERRLARLLLLLANFSKDPKVETVVPDVSQEALAAKVGVSQSRIEFFMNKFRELGFIEYEDGPQKNGGGLKVHNSLLNVVVHD